MPIVNFSIRLQKIMQLYIKAKIMDKEITECGNTLLHKTTIILVAMICCFFTFQKTTEANPAQTKGQQNNITSKQVSAAKSNPEDDGEINTTFYDVYNGFTKEELLLPQIGDRVLGCAKAPHTIIEYSSFSCPHCADYHESIWPKIKSELIDKCKVRYIYRDFPTTSSSAFASLIGYCLTKDDTEVKTYYGLLDAFFTSQNSWVFNSDYENKILQIIKLNGFAESQFRNCAENKNLANMILARAFVGQNKLNISYTPTLFVDGKKIDDILDFTSITKALDNDKKIIK